MPQGWLSQEIITREEGGLHGNPVAATKYTITLKQSVRPWSNYEQHPVKFRITPKTLTCLVFFLTSPKFNLVTLYTWWRCQLNIVFLTPFHRENILGIGAAPYDRFVSASAVDHAVNLHLEEDFICNLGNCCCTDWWRVFWIDSLKFHTSCKFMRLGETVRLKKKKK